MFNSYPLAIQLQQTWFGNGAGKSIQTIQQSLKPDNIHKDNSLTRQLHFSQFENDTKGNGIKEFTPQMLSCWRVQGVIVSLNPETNPSVLAQDWKR